MIAASARRLAAFDPFSFQRAQGEAEAASASVLRWEDALRNCCASLLRGCQENSFNWVDHLEPVRAAWLRLRVRWWVRLEPVRAAWLRLRVRWWVRLRAQP